MRCRHLGHRVHRSPPFIDLLIGVSDIYDRTVHPFQDAERNRIQVLCFIDEDVGGMVQVPLRCLPNNALCNSYLLDLKITMGAASC